MSFTGVFNGPVSWAPEPLVERDWTVPQVAVKGDGCCLVSHGRGGGRGPEELTAQPAAAQNVA